MCHGVGPAVAVAMCVCKVTGFCLSWVDVAADAWLRASSLAGSQSIQPGQYAGDASGSTGHHRDLGESGHSCQPSLLTVEHVKTNTFDQYELLHVTPIVPVYRGTELPSARPGCLSGVLRSSFYGSRQPDGLCLKQQHDLTTPDFLAQGDART